MHHQTPLVLELVVQKMTLDGLTRLDLGNRLSEAHNREESFATLDTFLRGEIVPTQFLHRIARALSINRGEFECIRAAQQTLDQQRTDTMRRDLLRVVRPEFGRTDAPHRFPAERFAQQAQRADIRIAHAVAKQGMG